MSEHKENLIKYRLEDSKEKLESARILIRNKKYKDSVSRSYYAMFSAARALLATQGLNSIKHSGIISLFNHHFVKEKIVDLSCGKVLASAKDAREESDYGDFIIVTCEEAESQIKDAHFFIEEIEKALGKIWGETE
ncbi:hypothetical protein CH333_03105 [candidate division WOR-3 bacterium JGI_Cruoil_03_44_89]|uniref:HEPN domain-containing protein n=1 Tax=candidate division WOR-3 bacterium JGI_Cruoil_03_44_89 TaxID=1973748 RepID=A0A235BWK0_UNCW3|nr:MAG: hypothetical protein CH333_03105 [candidate division WOR-3 bacterium JGI_Cruoil_03_44_89]